MRLSPARRAAARQQIAAALEQIAELAREFDLPPADKDLAAAIVGEMSVCWASLCDVRAANLKRYGSVDPDLAQTLDPGLDRLTEWALSLASTVRDNPED